MFQLKLLGKHNLWKREPVVKLVDVTRTYEQGGETIYAVDNVSFEIKKGSFISLCGPSGSGKTTLLNLIGGLDSPDSGQIYVGDNLITDLSESELADLRLNKLGFVFQAYNLVPVLSAEENVEFVMQLQGVARSVRREKARSLLKEIGLESMEKRLPGELSGGQQQRVAVARAIVTDPEIVLADEPTANLDSTTSKALLELMLKMNKERGVTFIFSTHDPLVMEYAERIIHLKDGKVDLDEKRS